MNEIQSVKKFSLEKRGNPKKGDVFNIIFKNKKVIEIPFFYRKKGIHPEGHFHKGIDPSTDPQLVIVINGKMKIKFEDKKHNKGQVILSTGEAVEIPKNMYHQYETLSDTIFCEPRVSIYDEKSADNHPIEDFK